MVESNTKLPYTVLHPFSLIENQTDIGTKKTAPLSANSRFLLLAHKAMDAVPSPWEFTCDLEVDYESDEKAQIVYTSLAVDKELQPDKVKRLMSVSNGKLLVHFEAVEARFLRASYSAFVDVLTLATKTIEQFSL